AQRDRAAAAEAEGGEPAAAAAGAQRVDERDQDAGAAGADRVAERDRAAVDVEAAPVPGELAVVGQHLGGERLVELDQVVVCDRVALAGQQLADRERRGGEDHGRLAGGLAVAGDARQRRPAELADPTPARDDQRGRAVGEAGRVAGRYAATGVEGRLQPGQRLERRVGARRLVAV